MCEIPEFYLEENRTCKKPAKCEECRGSIYPGTSYKALTGKWDGEVRTYKVHLKCFEIATKMREVLRANGLYYDELPGIGELVEASWEDACESDDFPQWWPQGVWISKKALREYVLSE